MIDPCQQTLSVALYDECSFENFLVGRNDHVMSVLRHLATGADLGLSVRESFLYVWGNSGVGRSHLLQAAVGCARAQGRSAIYITCGAPDVTPLVLAELESTALVCLDDLEQVLGMPEWEEALLHFYNRMRGIGHQLVVAGRQPPQQVVCVLPDLQSRLSWGLSFPILSLPDEDKVAALQAHARVRGMRLAPEVGWFLVHRVSRDMAVLCDLLADLDAASLVAKRRLTLPFVTGFLRAQPLESLAKSLVDDH